MFRPLHDRRFGSNKRFNAAILLVVLVFAIAYLLIVVVKAFSLLIGVGLLLAAAFYGKREALRQARHGHRDAGIATLVGISPLDFEKHVAETYRQQGYRVELTRGSSDQGVDILATTNDQRIGIQCKRYTGVVGNDAVQQAFAGKTFYNCTHAVVVTTGNFTPSARVLAQKTGVQLIDGKQYSDMLRSLGGLSVAGPSLSAWVPQGRALAIQLGLVALALVAFSMSSARIPSPVDLVSALGIGSRQTTNAQPYVQKQAQPASGFDDRVIAFYEALNNRQFETAYAMLSDSFRQGGSYAKWKAGYSNTESIAVAVTPVDSNSASVRMTAVDRTPSGSVTRHFIGSWAGVRGDDGQWYLDSGQFSIVSVAKAPAASVSARVPQAEESTSVQATEPQSVGTIPNRQALLDEVNDARYQLNSATYDLNPALRGLQQSMTSSLGPAKIHSDYHKAWTIMQQYWEQEQQQAAVIPLTCYGKSQVQYTAGQVAYELSQIKYVDGELSYLRSSVEPNLADIDKALPHYVVSLNRYIQKASEYDRYFGNAPNHPPGASAAQIKTKVDAQTAAARARLDDLAKLQGSMDTQGSDLTTRAKQFADSLECSG